MQRLKVSIILKTSLTYLNYTYFYLKVNRLDGYCFYNLQHWIDIVYQLDYDFYIVCDNIKLENRILRNVVFKDLNIKFIKSIKNRISKKIVKNTASHDWYNAGYAHLTTFLHAKKYNFKEFWNIDADDTMLCMEPKKCCEAIKQAENYAKEKDISAFSLDMWRSITKGEHWSFGVTYIRQNIDYLKIFNEIKNCSWIENYEFKIKSWNIDLFFNYLKDFKNINLQNFYIENLTFFHFGDFLFNIISSGIYVYKNGCIEFPIIKQIYENDEYSKIPINNECVKFDLNLPVDYCKNYIFNNKIVFHYYAKKK